MLENIFSKTIKSSNNKLNDYNKDNFNVTESYLELLLVLEESYFNINSDHMRVTHLALKESNIEILTEGIGDFIHSVIKFFKDLLNRFTKFIKSIFMVIYAYIGDLDSFITKYKDKLKELNPNFTVKGYKYTFESNIPKLNEVTNVINDYNNELSQVHTMSKADIIKEREEFTSETFMNKVRAKVIGVSGEVASDDFLDRTKSIYRNNEDKVPQEISVDKMYLNSIIENYSNLKKVFTDTTSERDKVITLITSMKNFFEKSASTYYKDTNKMMGMHSISLNSNSSGIVKDERVEHQYDMKKMDVINTFFNFKYTQSKEIGNICVTAIIEKVNALKECMKMNKMIIHKSLFSGTDTNTEMNRGGN